MKRYGLLLALLLCTPAAAIAQRPAEFERVLLPVYNAPMPGAFGSIWTTELWMHNSGDSDAWIRYPECHVSACAPSFNLRSGSTVQPPIARRPAGVLLWIPKERSSSVHFTLRAQDVSRQAQTWGTDIPAVREAEFLTSTAHLLNVPTTEAFRQTLRIYDAESRAEAEFLVRIYDQDSNALISERAFKTVGAGNPPPDYGMPGQPGSVEIGPFASIIGIPPTITRVRLEVVPLTSGVRFWTFMSVTNNETQHITLITPQ
jgi:hypothetical protein